MRFRCSSIQHHYHYYHSVYLRFIVLKASVLTINIICVQFGFSINSIILLHDWRWDRTASFTTTITAHFSNHDPLTEFGDFSYWTKKKHKFSVIEVSYKIKFSSFHINETTFTLNCLMVPSKATALPEK